jgi:hypothetical protein
MISGIILSYLFGELLYLDSNSIHKRHKLHLLYIRDCFIFEEGDIRMPEAQIQIQRLNANYDRNVFLVQTPARDSLYRVDLGRKPAGYLLHAMLSMAMTHPPSKFTIPSPIPSLQNLILLA